MSRLGILVLSAFAYMNFWYFYARLKQRNDVADIAWGLGFTFLAWLSLGLCDVITTRSSLVTGLVTIWGLRLAIHIALRHQRLPEDPRYFSLRRWAYLKVFMLQGALMLIIMLPVFRIQQVSQDPINWLDGLGVLIWCVGFFFESVADFQLAQFKKEPKHRGKIIQSGLWRYSRHPNYFGEVLVWWGIWLLALNVSEGWQTIVGPMTITFLILKVSGITMLEKKMQENREFADYRSKTSQFLPWFPKQK